VVEDDGIGMPETPAGDRFGLRGMEERLALVGGSLELESAPGRGTTLLATVPA
jgi:signal transduction histidine kinase